MSLPEDKRFDSWKEIASHLGRDIRTVRRWEEDRGLPVHRVPGDGRRAVFAYRSEIDDWLRKADHELAENNDVPLRPVRRGSGMGRGLEANLRRDNSDQSENKPLVEATPRAGASTTRTKFLIGGLAILGVLFLSAAISFFLGAKASSVVNPPLAHTPAVPRGIEHWLRVSLVNGQPVRIPGPFQQLIVVDSSRYTSYEAENLQNVEFFDEQGGVLQSWLESGNSRLSTRTIYWARLPDGMPASKVVDIYMGFAAVDRNTLNALTSGEAATLSPNYGEYDSGFSVFLKYANFSGESLPPGWYSGLTPGGQGTIRIHNGMFLAHSDRGGGSAYLGSDWPVGDNLAEMDLSSQQTVNGQEMILVCSASPSQYRWTPYSVGYQNMSGLEIEDNNAGTPSVVATAKPNPNRSAVIGFQGGTLFADYQPVARIYPRICGGAYLAASVNSGLSASFSFDWVRLRTPPPNGVMPTAIFGEFK